MMMSPTAVPGKPYAVPTQWARVVQTQEGEPITSPRAEAPQIIYGADGTQYYAVPKGAAGFTPTMATPPGGSVIVSPTQVGAPQQVTNVAATTATTTNYPAYVTVPIPATSTAIFHPVAIPVQGVHTPAFVIRPPYPGSTVYSPTILHPATTSTPSAVPVAYQNMEHRTIEAQAKTESTNTIVKTPDGETIVIIQRPMESGGAVPVQLKEAATATSNALTVGAHPHIFQQHIVQHTPAQTQQDLKQIIIEQPVQTSTQS